MYHNKRATTDEPYGKSTKMLQSREINFIRIDMSYDGDGVIEFKCIGCVRLRISSILFAIFLSLAGREVKHRHEDIIIIWLLLVELNSFGLCCENKFRNQFLIPKMDLKWMTPCNRAEFGIAIERKRRGENKKKENIGFES